MDLCNPWSPGREIRIFCCICQCCAVVAARAIDVPKQRHRDCAPCPVGVACNPLEPTRAYDNGRSVKQRKHNILCQSRGGPSAVFTTGAVHSSAGHRMSYPCRSTCFHDTTCFSLSVALIGCRASSAATTRWRFPAVEWPARLCEPVTFHGHRQNITCMATGSVPTTQDASSALHRIGTVPSFRPSTPSIPHASSPRSRRTSLRAQTCGAPPDQWLPRCPFLAVWRSQGEMGEGG